MSLDTQEKKITLTYEDWSIEVEEPSLERSFLLKHVISDSLITDNTVSIPEFDIPISKKNLEEIFNFVKQYNNLKDENTDIFKFGVDFIEHNDYFMQNFGDILQVVQYFQVECLSDLMEKYLANIINQIDTTDTLCDTFGWGKTEIHDDLAWTTQSNDW